jgi:hypothetical protein
LHFKKEDGQCFDNINSGESRWFCSRRRVKI